MELVERTEGNVDVVWVKCVCLRFRMIGVRMLLALGGG